MKDDHEGEHELSDDPVFAKSLVIPVLAATDLLETDLGTLDQRIFLACCFEQKAARMCFMLNDIEYHVGIELTEDITIEMIFFAMMHHTDEMVRDILATFTAMTPEKKRTFRVASHQN